MGGYQYGRGDSTDDDPRSRGQGGGGRRGYGSSGDGDGAAGGGQSPQSRGYGSGGGTRGYGSPGAGGGSDPFVQQPPPTPQHPSPGAAAGSGGSAGSGGGTRGYDPYGGSPAPGASPAAPSGGRAAGGGRRGYGSGSGSRGRGGAGHNEPITGELAGAGTRPSPDPGATRVQDAAEVGAAVPEPRRSRLEERRAARGGDVRDPSQTRSDQYPESALNGRSTRNGAASRAGARARAAGGGRPGGPVKKTGYHRYFDYPRTGKYGWKHWAPSIKQVTGCFLAGFFMVLGLVVFEYETVVIPDVNSTAFAQESNFTYDDASTSFATDGPSNRTIADYSDIPMMIQNAVVAQEDKTFWTNPGVSYTGTARALMVDLMGGSLQGGSTITQQYVKNAYLTQAQTTSRKVDEIFIALKLSRMYDKKTIMADYLNTSPFGRNTDGIEAGVKAWFNISLAQMNKEPAAEQASQSAFLSMMLNSPSTYSAGWDPSQTAATQKAAQTAALGRWKDTLSNMEAYKLITPDVYAQAVASPPKVVALSTTSDSESMTAAQMKQASLDWLDSYDSAHKTTDPNAPTKAEIEDNGGYTVVTTFDAKYMTLAKQAVQTELLSKETKFDQSTLQPGLAAVDPSTGDLVAFYGGSTYENNATQRTAQGGSTFKAFTLATALTNNWSPDSYLNGNVWPDVTVNPDEKTQDAGAPDITNDGSTAKVGWMTLQQATDQSVNTAFVRLEMAQPNNYTSVEQMAEQFGMSSSTPGWTSNQGGCDNARFTLGVCPTDPARMASVYGVLAADGTLHSLTEIKEIKEPNGAIWKPQTTTTQVVSSNVAATETKLLTGVIHNSDGTANSSYRSSGLDMTNIAGKTGTSTMDYTASTKTAMSQVGYNNHDGTFTTAGIWFDGYSSKLAISVGISRWTNITLNGQQVATQLPVDNIADSGLDYGATYPFAIWADFMKQMQGTSMGGDETFTTPQPNPNATVYNSPSASPSPSPTPSKTTQSPAPPTQTQYTPTASPSASCTPSLIDQCDGTGNGGGSTPSDSASASASPSDTSTGRRNGGGTGGT
ncbi:penicillin-binding protein [Actinospica durhamensis]|uniref:Penicillin-binding protein n=1 Tax=Actinospica durhamensis TaxID=1508375 RepID=A0A941IKC1_9ACTN|nr:transglycosylase domain-containing protein [Actinospica durhamensis]MBR7831675.1 penicillin-binding protein [Actinospica durhamensis]